MARITALTARNAGSHQRFTHAVAGILLDSPGRTPEDARRALPFARHAIELHRRLSPDNHETSAFILDTLAACWSAAGDARKALETQRELLALPLPQHLRSQYEGRLRDYERAVGETER